MQDTVAAASGSDQVVGLRRRTPVVVAAGLLAALGALTYAAMGTDHFAGEVRISLWVQSAHTSWLDTLMKAVSAPGGQPQVVLLVLAASALLYLRGRGKEGALLLASILVTLGITFALKHLVERPRPLDGLVRVLGDSDGFSFPSSHVAHSTVFLGLLIFFSTRYMRPSAARWLLQGSLATLLLAEGVSRVYIGAHWAGDVLAGYVMGSAVVAAAIAVWWRWPSPGVGRRASEAPQQRAGTAGGSQAGG